MILNMLLNLPEDHSYLRIIRLLGRTLLEHLRVVDQDTSDLETIVDELCSNVLRHAQSTTGRFEVDLKYFADRAIVTVKDSGVGFSFKDVPVVGEARSDFDGSERFGGYGLELVRAMSERLQFFRTDMHGTTVRAEKLLHYNTNSDRQDAVALDQNNKSDFMIQSNQKG